MSPATAVASPVGQVKLWDLGSLCMADARWKWNKVKQQTNKQNKRIKCERKCAVIFTRKKYIVIAKMTSSLNGINEKADPVDELQNVSDFFEANASVIERWLKEKAPDEVVNKINAIASKRTTKEKEHRSSVTSELYQQWLSSSNTPLKVSQELFLCTKHIFLDSSYLLGVTRRTLDAIST